MSGLLVVSGRANPVTVFSTFEPDNLYVSKSGDLVENVSSSFRALAAALTLQAGTQYWIGVRAPSIQTSSYWNFATPAHTGTVAISTDVLLRNCKVISDQDQFAFDVLATIPVPEAEPAWRVVTGMIWSFGIAKWRTCCSNILERALSRSGSPPGSAVKLSATLRGGASSLWRWPCARVSGSGC
jgi:hypothetical protein